MANSNFITWNIPISLCVKWFFFPKNIFGSHSLVWELVGLSETRGSREPESLTRTKYDQTWVIAAWKVVWEFPSHSVFFFKHKHFVKHDLLVISRTESFFYLLLFSCYKSKTAKIAIVYLFRAITPTRSGLTTSNQLKLLSSFKSEEQKSLRISCIYKFSRKK